MSSVLSPKKPDTSAQEARLAQQEQATAKRDREISMQEAAKRKARSRGGAQSLLSGGETGVSRDTLS